MLINGEKWSCETCIKGHRATHCKHTDRPLVPIKKKGRPSTQCKRCRELRIVRQLHVKCDCDDQGDRITKKKKESSNTVVTGMKKKIKIDILRPIAPKQENSSPSPLPPLLTPQLPSIITTPPPLPPTPVIEKKGGGCCGKKKKQPESTTVTQSSVSCCSSNTTTTTTSTTVSAGSVVTNKELKISPPTSCGGPISKNQQGEMIRIVTCRCGDSCACIGCDAHPSRAMKEGRDDVYIGFEETKRRLSIAAITTFKENENNNPSSVLRDDGVYICGCGCGKGFDDCSNCFNELCQDSYL